MAKNLKTYEKDGASVAELVIPTEHGSRTYVAVVSPADAAKVRAQVERMARQHNDRISGSDPDDVLPPSGSASKKSDAADPDAPMGPSKKAPSAKVVVGPVKKVSAEDKFYDRGTFSKAAILTRKSRLWGDSGYQISGEEVDHIVGNHLRAALAGMLRKKLKRQNSLVGVTNFSSPPERFVDDGWREQQMKKAGDAGMQAMDKYQHDAVFGEASKVRGSAFVGLAAIGAGDIEDGVVYLGKRRGTEIVQPDEVMDPPEDLLFRETTLDEEADAPADASISTNMKLPNNPGVSGWSLKKLGKGAVSLAKKGAKTTFTLATLPAKTVAQASLKLGKLGVRGIEAAVNKIGQAATYPIRRAARATVVSTAKAIARKNGRSAPTSADKKAAGQYVIAQYLKSPLSGNLKVKSLSPALVFSAMAMKKFGTGVSGDVGADILHDARCRKAVRLAGVGAFGADDALLVAAGAAAVLAVQKFVIPKSAPTAGAAAPGALSEDPSYGAPEEEYAQPEGYDDGSYAEQPTEEYYDESMGAVPPARSAAAQQAYAVRQLAARARAQASRAQQATQQAPGYVASRDARKRNIALTVQRQIRDRFARFEAYRGGRPQISSADASAANARANSVLQSVGLPTEQASPAWQMSEAQFRDRARAALARASQMTPDPASLPPLPLPAYADQAPASASAAPMSAPASAGSPTSGPAISPTPGQNEPTSDSGPEEDLTEEELAAKEEYDE